MSVTRVQINTPDNWNDEPTQAELDSVPPMSRSDMHEIMKTDEYKQSSKARKLVAHSIKKYGIQDAPSDAEPVQTGDEILAKRETVAALMRDPRYKHDAAYRFEVQQKIANLTAYDNAGLSADDLKTPNTQVSIGVSTSPYHGAALAVRRFHRVELEPTLTGPDAPAKPSKPSREPFSSK